MLILGIILILSAIFTSIGNDILFLRPIGFILGAIGVYVIWKEMNEKG